MPDALALAAKRPGSPDFGRMLARVLHDVQAGLLLPEACARHPEVFHRLYITALRTGEKTRALNLRQMIRDRRPAADLPAAAIAEGMITLRRAALMKALAGETTLKGINRVTSVE